MDIKQLQEQRNALHTQMQALATGTEKFDAEKRSKFDAMNADVAAIESDITRLESVAKFEAEQRSAPRIPRSQPGAEIEGDKNTVAQEINSKDLRF